jgi:O-methyltransferase
MTVRPKILNSLQETHRKRLWWETVEQSFRLVECEILRMLQSLVRFEGRIPTKYRFTRRFSRAVIHRFQQKILSFYKGPDISGLIRQVRAEVDCQILSNEGYMVYSVARAQATMEGAMAEVGAYQGASAKLICEAKGETEFHVFDTFCGLVDAGDKDPLFRQSDYSASETAVRQYLSAYPNVHIHKGFFPAATGDVVRDKKFSFVNLDVDTYASTRDSLEFFYPRLLPGGILMSHDYAQADGVRKAFDEVLKSRPESVIELPESQCMLIKQG